MVYIFGLVTNDLLSFVSAYLWFYISMKNVLLVEMMQGQTNLNQPVNDLHTWRNLNEFVCVCVCNVPTFLVFYVVCYHTKS